MAKFCRVIVNLVLVVALLAAAALLVPSFVGIETYIIEDNRLETNLPVGSVTYASQKGLEDLRVGDKILYGEDGSNYEYKISAIEKKTQIVIMKDAHNDGADSKEILLTTNVPVTIVTVPYLGYVAVYASTPRGWIVIGLVIFLLLILLILSFLWGRKDEDEDDEYEDEEEEELPRKKKRKNKKQDDDDEDDVILTRKEYKEKKKAEKQLAKEQKAAKKAAKKKVKVNGQEIKPEIVDVNDIPDGQDASSSAEIFESVREEIASSVTDAMNGSEEESADAALDIEKEVAAALAEAASNPDAVQVSEEALAQPEIEVVKEEAPQIMIPIYSADELIRRAIVAGDDPEIKEDSNLGITFLDYSDIL